MKAIDPGHAYDLDVLDDQRGVPERLVFVKREGKNYPGNVGHHPGTNCQEVIRALIDRVKYRDAQIPDNRNNEILNDLRHALWIFELRAAERYGRDFGIGDRLHRIEEVPTCSRCGHIGCNDSCNPLRKIEGRRITKVVQDFGSEPAMGTWTFILDNGSMLMITAQGFTMELHEGPELSAAKPSSAQPKV